MDDLTDKKVIITGASGGIGTQLAWHVARRGGVPILIARSQAKLQKLAADISFRHSKNVYVYPTDLTDARQVESVFCEIINHHENIVALINNAGVGKFAYAQEMELEETEAMFRLNVFAVIQASKLTTPLFIRQGFGHIVIVASQAGKIATPKSSVYAATKHAILGYANALRMELQPENVYVTTVNPGPVQTEFLDLADPEGGYKKQVERYLLDPDQVAEKIARSLLKQKREINMPFWMEAGSRLYHVAPGMMERLLKRQFSKK